MAPPGSAANSGAVRTCPAPRPGLDQPTRLGEAARACREPADDLRRAGVRISEYKPVLLAPPSQFIIRPESAVGTVAVWPAVSVFWVVTNRLWSGACPVRTDSEPPKMSKFWPSYPIRMADGLVRSWFFDWLRRGTVLTRNRLAQLRTASKTRRIISSSAGTSPVPGRRYRLDLLRCQFGGHIVIYGPEPLLIVDGAVVVCVVVLDHPGQACLRVGLLLLVFGAFLWRVLRRCVL